MRLTRNGPCAVCRRLSRPTHAAKSRPNRNVSAGGARASSASNNGADTGDCHKSSYDITFSAGRNLGVESRDLHTENSQHVDEPKQTTSRRLGDSRSQQSAGRHKQDLAARSNHTHLRDRGAHL
jgi:hypothetical protein